MRKRVQAFANIGAALSGKTFSLRTPLSIKPLKHDAKKVNFGL